MFMLPAVVTIVLVRVPADDVHLFLQAIGVHIVGNFCDGMPRGFVCLEDAKLPPLFASSADIAGCCIGDRNGGFAPASTAHAVDGFIYFIGL